MRVVGVACAMGACLSNASALEPVSMQQLLRTSTTWDGTPIEYSRTTNPEVQAIAVRIEPGGATAWHKHPVNNFAFLISGTLRVELEGGKSREFAAGSAFAEVVGTWHRGVNVGTDPVRIAVFYTGESGGPISIPKPAPEAPVPAEPRH